MVRRLSRRESLRLATSRCSRGLRGMTSGVLLTMVRLRSRSGRSQANWKPIIPPMLMPTRCTGPQPSRSSSAAQSSAKPAML